MERHHGSITINGNITINNGNIDITITKKSLDITWG